MACAFVLFLVLFIVPVIVLGSVHTFLVVVNVALFIVYGSCSCFCYFSCYCY